MNKKFYSKNKNDQKIFIFYSIKNVIKKKKLWNFEVDRTKIAEVTAEWKFCRSYIIRYEVILQEKLSYFIKSQLEVTAINFRLIHEDNRFPNDADLKIKFEIFNMGVDFI